MGSIAVGTIGQLRGCWERQPGAVKCLRATVPVRLLLRNLQGVRCQRRHLTTCTDSLGHLRFMKVLTAPAQ